jgi:hypothetical protein
MSVLPAVLAIFIPSLRHYLLIISLLNLCGSSFDIMDVIQFLRLPNNSICFIYFVLKVKDIKQPIVIHKLSITPELDKVHHRQFEYFEGKLTEKENVTDTTATEQLKKEFISQYNL